MIEFKRLSLSLQLSVLLASLLYAFAPAWAADSVLSPFTEEVERDVSLKKLMPITLIHQVGKVSIQGWVQDRIRVVLKKRVIAENEIQAQALFRRVDLLTLETQKNFEMRVGVARGEDLVSKLKAQKQNTVEVDLEIKAPYQLALTLILGTGHDFTVQQWKGPLTVNAREATGSLTKLDMKAAAQISCLGCNLEVTDSKLNGHLLGSNRSIVLRNTESDGLLIDTSSGEVKLENSKGKFMVHTESGVLKSQQMNGDLSFQSDSGGMFLTGQKGKVEAQSMSGQMIIEADQVDRLFNLDTQKGDIQLSLLPNFQGKLDLSSLKGDVVVQFPVEAIKSRTEAQFGPALPGRVNATVGNASGVVVHAETKQGSIRVLRRDPRTQVK